MSTLGPMATDRDTLELFMKVILSTKPWRLDPSLTAKDWTPYKFTRPLKIAVQWWDGVVMPHPPMIRALKEVSEACKAAGMEVVDWDCGPLDHRKGWEITAALYWPDGGEEVLGLIEEAGEPILPLTKFIIHEQPSVKKLDQHGLWKVSYIYILHTSAALIKTPHTALCRKRRLPRSIRQILDQHRQGRWQGSRRYLVPAIIWRSNTTRTIALLGLHFPLEPT